MAKFYVRVTKGRDSGVIKVEKSDDAGWDEHVVYGTLSKNVTLQSHDNSLNKVDIIERMKPRFDEVKNLRNSSSWR
jgi:hypothetical protein